MRSRMRTAGILLLTAAATLAIGVAGCSLFGEKGTVTISLTDAPIDAASVKGVYITVSEIQYNLSTGGEDNWRTFENFLGPRTIDLLSKTDGVAEALGTLAMPAGQYNQIRFMLDAPEEGTGLTAKPPSYILFKDDSWAALFIPSADKTGFKAVSAFQVPVNGNVSITADFDLRRSIRTTNRHSALTYLMRPTLRLVVENEAGRITGKGTNLPVGHTVAVFAYADGTYAAAEATPPAADSTSTTQFAGTVTSATLKLDAATGDWRYVLAFLAAGTYDLVVASFDPATQTWYTVKGYIPDVVVSAGQATAADFDWDTIPATLP
jgi:hypothetical protein